MQSRQVQRPGNKPSPLNCPLCGQPNQCVMAQRAAQADNNQEAAGTNWPECWCTTKHFAPSLLARVPASARNRACICPACVQAAASD